MLHSSVRVAHEDEKRSNHNGTKNKTMQGRISQKCQSAVTEAAEWGRKYQWQQRSCKMPNQKNSKGKKSKRSNSNGDEQENGGCAAATGGAAAAAAPRSQRSSGKRGSGHRCRSLVMLPSWLWSWLLPVALPPSAAAPGRSSGGWKRSCLDRRKLYRSITTWGLVRIKWMDSGRRWLCEAASSTALRSVLVRGSRPTAAVCYDTRRREEQAKSLNTTEARRSSRAEERLLHYPEEP